MGFEVLALALMATLLGVQHALQRVHPRMAARAWDAQWAQVLDRLGFDDDGESGQIRGVGVHVRRMDHPSAPRRRVIVDLDGLVPPSLAMTEHPAPDDVRAALFGAHVLTGDARFDARYIVRAAPDLDAVAALRPEARERWLSIPEVTFSLDEGLARGVDAPVHAPWCAADGLALVALVEAALGIPDPMPARMRAEVLARVGAPGVRHLARSALASSGHDVDLAIPIRKRMQAWIDDDPQRRSMIEAAVLEGPACPSDLRASLTRRAVNERRFGVRAVRRAWRNLDPALARAVFTHAPPDVDPGAWPLPSGATLRATIATARSVSTMSSRRWLVAVALRAAPSDACAAIDALASRSSVDAVVALRRIASATDVPPDVRRHARRRLPSTVRSLGTAPGRVSIAGARRSGDLSVPDGPDAPRSFTP